MKNKKIPVLSFVLYILAVLLFGYAVWALIYSSGIVTEAVSFGQLVVKGNEYEVISFYMGNVALYALFAIVFFALGWILQVVTPQEQIEVEVELPDDEIDELLSTEVEE